MAIDLQYANDIRSFVVSTTNLNEPGKKGSIYETTTSDGFYGAQLCQLVDAGGVAGDAVYHKTYGNSFVVTPTIGNSSTGELAGWLTTTVAANEWCWVQKRGVINAKANGVFADGTPVWVDSGNNRVIPAGVFSGSLGAAGAAAGDILGVANPCTGAWLVTSIFITTTTKSTGASTIDVGVAANSSTLNDGLIDGLDTGTAVVTNANNFANAGTNGKASQQGAAGTVLTGSEASGDTTGMVGTYFGTFIPLGVTNARLRVVGIAQAAVSGGKVMMFADLPYVPRQLNG